MKVYGHDAGSLPVNFFDGRTGRPWPAHIRREGEQLRLTLVATQDGAQPHADAAYALSQLRWPARTTGVLRTLLLLGGASIQTGDALAWDSWVASSIGLKTHPIERLVRSRWSFGLAIAVMLCAVWLVLWAGWTHAGAALLPRLPTGFDRSVGDAVAAEFDASETNADKFWRPSRLSEARRAPVLERFAALVQHTAQLRGLGSVSLRVVSSKGRANVFTLPNGTIYINDAFILAAQDMGSSAQSAVDGVMLGELFHLRERHAMHGWLRQAVLGVAAAGALGDFAGLSSGMPQALGRRGYTPAMQTATDDFVMEVLAAWAAYETPYPGSTAAQGVGKPMADLLERLAQTEGEATPTPERLQVYALASHLPDAKRLARLRGQAAPAAVQP